VHARVNDRAQFGAPVGWRPDAVTCMIGSIFRIMAYSAIQSPMCQAKPAAMHDRIRSV